MKRLLLVEDEPGLVLTLTDRLTAEGYTVTSIGDGNAAVDRALREPYDIIVLDVMLPGRDGFDVCRAVRQRGMRAPILMLTARGQVVDRVVGLKLGADDYLVKPFEMAELLARLEALLRRAPRARTAGAAINYRFGDIDDRLRAGPKSRATARRRALGARVQAAALFRRASRRRRYRATSC